MTPSPTPTPTPVSLVAIQNGSDCYLGVLMSDGSNRYIADDEHNGNGLIADFEHSTDTEAAFAFNPTPWDDDSDFVDWSPIPSTVDTSQILSGHVVESQSGPELYYLINGEMISLTIEWDSSSPMMIPID